MTLIIVHPYGEMKNKYEKMGEYIDGEFRGDPETVDEYRHLEGEDEEVVARAIDGPVYFAVEHDPDSDMNIHKLGWFTDPDWEPENPEYKQQEGEEGN